MEKKSTQIINPGPSKEIWDEALTRHGIDPKNITEYNVPDSKNVVEPTVNPGPSKEIWDEALTRHGIDPKNITEYNVPDSK